MATQEQIETIASMLYKLRPAPFFEQVNKSHMGIGALMGFLHKSEKPVTAGDIANLMHVSTARVAVLLRKIESKGLIVKEKSPGDARVTIVRLTEMGEETCAKMQAGLHEKISMVIDQVGMDRLVEFFAVAGEIARLDPRPDCDSDLCKKFK